MRNIFEIQAKYKVALALLSMIILMLLGVLVERKFLSKLNVNSISMYNDRLVPSIVVYHLSDHSTQRMIATKNYLINDSVGNEKEMQGLLEHRQQEDSLIKAFEQTFLVADEGRRLNELKINLAESYEIQDDLLQGNSNYSDADVDLVFSNIREELQELSKIQTRVGQTLLEESKILTSRAGVVSQFLVAILIIVCLVAQGFILASKAITPTIRQKHHLN